MLTGCGCLIFVIIAILYVIFSGTDVSILGKKVIGEEQPAHVQTVQQTPAPPAPSEVAVYYPSVQIGNQIWTSSNMNEDIDGSYCFNDNQDNCRNAGRLYTWKAAQRVCGNGWHLPSSEEFETLKRNAGENGGNKLKDKRSWRPSLGSNSLGFNAFAAGMRDESGDYMDFNEYAYYWTSNSINGNKAFLWFLYAKNSDFVRGSDDKRFAFSVRCIKD